jgi:hypothetical protein
MANLPPVPPNSIPEIWRKTPLPLSGGKEVVVYRGFADKVNVKKATIVNTNDLQGGQVSRKIDAAHDAVFNQYGRDPVLNGPDSGGVVMVRIPAKMWDDLVGTNSISERPYYGFSRKLDSTEIRVNSVAAARLINSLPKEVLPPDAKYDFRPK